jgi:hypothetical protein
MIGTGKDDVDPEKMTSAELQAHFTQLLAGHAHDMDTHLCYVYSKLSDAMVKIDCLEESFNAKLDAKFWEVWAWLPQPGVPAPCAHRVPLTAPPVGTVTTATAATDAATHVGCADDEGEDELEDENMLHDEEVQQPAPGVHSNTTTTLIHLHHRYVIMIVWQSRN